MSLVTSANTPAAKATASAHKLQRQPPGAVSSRHAGEQPDVAGDDSRNETRETGPSAGVDSTATPWVALACAITGRRKYAVEATFTRRPHHPFG
jgi:hypothetical protein